MEKTDKNEPVKKKRKERAKAVKVSDAQFFAILRENAGLFSRTARAISSQFGVPYTRQAVRDRANRQPEILADIEEENLDIAEEGLNSIMRSKSEALRLEAVKFFLKTKGKGRGYVEKSQHSVEHSGSVGQIIIEPVTGLPAISRKESDIDTNRPDGKAGKA